MLARLDFQAALDRRLCNTVEHRLGDVGQCHMVAETCEEQPGVTATRCDIQHFGAPRQFYLLGRSAHIFDVFQNVSRTITMTLPGELFLGGALDCVEFHSRSGSEWFGRAAQRFDSLEAETFVEAVRVFGAEMMANGLKVGMFEETFHHPFAKTFTAVLKIDDDVADPRKGCMIGHGTGKADLPSFVEQAKANRVLDGFFNDRAGTVVSPVGGFEQGADNIEIEPAGIVGQQVISIAPFAVACSIHRQQAVLFGRV